MHLSFGRIPAVIAALTLVSLSALAAEGPSISHIPIPLAVKGKPIPVIAGVDGGGEKIQSVSLSIRTTETATEAKIDMTPAGKNKYKALIPAKSTAHNGLMYKITAVSAKGTSSTIWYPVKTGSIDDKANDTAKDQSKDMSRVAKAKAAIVAHPYISAAAAVGTVGVAAVAGGGGGDGGGSRGGSSVFVGHISGNWSGEGWSGSFSVTIGSDGGVSGSYSGDASGSLSGSVSGDGSFSASGSAGGAVWSGTVLGSSGSLSASGTWSGYSLTGSWSGSGG